MKVRAGLLVTCAAGAVAIGLGCASPALAADVMPTKAPVAALPFWWYEGFAEIGYRDYLNDPDKAKLGRFYRYEDWSSRRVRQLLLRCTQDRRGPVRCHGVGF